jgi:CspA family cold shock protein
MLEGRVKFFNSDRGFGFIAGDDGRDMFVHVNDLRRSGLERLSEGDRVRFDVEAGKSGKEHAIEVSVVAK